jgi:mono/diheme cytochrome c family protein
MAEATMVQSKRHRLCCVLILALAAIGCGDDDTGNPEDAGPDGAAANSGSGGKAGSAGKAGSGGKAGSAGETGSQGGAGGNPEAGSGGSGGRSGPQAGSGGSGPSASAIERGRYLVENIAACGDCHTPRLSNGAPDNSKLLSGVDCFVDANPSDPDFGCLSSRNLTNHETGLKNRSDQEIKDMILKGERPADSGGAPSALHPVMPYFVLGNMNDADASAIVAFLRRLPAIDHRVKARQAPFNLDAPAPRFPLDKIPQPKSDYPERDAAMRGRYLAGNVGVCLECHTPRDVTDAPLVDKAFWGGRVFNRDDLGLPMSLPTSIYTSNITPDATGIQGWSVEDLVKALKAGTDKMGGPLCPPMPSGPMGPFGGITDNDARDIAHYLLSIPAGNNPLDDCSFPPPVDVDAGPDAG